MSLSAQVTFADDTELNFDEIANVLNGASADLGNFVIQPGRYLMDLAPSAPVVDQRIFHVVGANGNSIIRCGNTGGPIELVVRYVDSLSNVRNHMTLDQYNFSNQSCELVDDAGQTWDNMNLIQGSAKQIGKIRATGWLTAAMDGDNVVMVDASYTLRMDGAPNGEGSD